MTYTPTIYDRIEDVPAAEWARVCDPADLAMDPRLLGAFQATMSDQCRCWFVMLRDMSGEPVAAACLCLFRIDALETTGPMAQRITRNIRRFLPGYMRFRVLFCGLPTPSAANHLRIAPHADRNAVLQTLHDTMRTIARENRRARLMVMKEFEDSQRHELSALEDIGFIRGDVPSARRLERTFDSFDEYLAALRAQYRKQVKESLTKFRRGECTPLHLSGVQIADAMNDELHQLYLAVRDRAKYRMETFPPEFFGELARRFGDDAAMTIVRRDDRVIGWAFSLTGDGECHNLYIGLDYDQNASADVYFNLHYLDLDRAFRRGCRRIHLGQTSDEFKSRLGCVAEPMSFYVRAVNPVVHAALRKLARWVFPPVKQPALLNVFRSDQAATTSAPLEAAASSARQAPGEESTLRRRR